MRHAGGAPRHRSPVCRLRCRPSSLPAPPARSRCSTPSISAGKQGVDAAIARLNVRAADARTASVGPTSCPISAAGRQLTRQTLNLDEFGIPMATGITDPFNIYNLQLRASQTLFDASAIARLRAGRDTAIAAGLDAQAAVRSPAPPPVWRTSGSSARMRRCGPARRTAPSPRTC